MVPFYIIRISTQEYKLKGSVEQCEKSTCFTIKNCNKKCNMIEGLSAQTCLVRNRSFEKNGFESSQFSRQKIIIAKACLLQKIGLCKNKWILFLYKENIVFFHMFKCKRHVYCTKHVDFAWVWQNSRFKSIFWEF